ncbi:unnamed protein product [Rotaria socialis]|uniref:glutathione transferase n=1 Tax=Rotaria socialis TaxID=392032 RepID=A0A817RJD6_9BILA|nr:unnamed protein product [Rotaria socialis]CAF3455108.1 unnamed protein product [Rotaria socialis]CAF3468146.1 unnamed protein product [Rotaria socialis]CAF3674696.1 unnamed protein product [Rotaria socialis]CAF3681302.1 unnamed protein product [Rotaria socialis]
MTITVYGSYRSTCTKRVLTTLHEKGLKFEFQPIDLSKGEQKDPKYLEEKQPFGVIPVLVDDGFQIYESRAICRYLELKYKDKGTELVPTNINALGLFEQAASIESANFDPYASGIVFEKVFKKRKGLGEPDEAKVASLKEQLNAKMDVYDTILSKQSYLGGQVFTLADLFHLPYGTLLVACGEGSFFESRPNVKAWWNRITSRPSWIAVKDLE